MELGQKGKGRTFKLYHDVPERYKATEHMNEELIRMIKLRIQGLSADMRYLNISSRVNSGRSMSPNSRLNVGKLVRGSKPNFPLIDFSVCMKSLTIFLLLGAKVSNISFPRI